ncbi:fasciclin domain protein [Chaetomium tenue]|uniref:Fasciclin domain protein n=1 Tax=Chaetomium tenue TaxID=1854479 RepID=A0ACB7P313_9PEZI|nr:fasciclin domain protein [Chaetomium globosum]
MKPFALLFAATTAALVTPGVVRKQQTPLATDQDKTAEQNVVQAWWDGLPNPTSLMSPIEDRITKSIQQSSHRDFLSLIESEAQEEDHPHPHPRPPHRRHGRHGHRGDPDKTIYELIKENKHTTRFAHLVEKHDEIKHLLQDTKHNHTLFVPTDRAFKHFLLHHGGGGDDDDDDDDGDHHKGPSKEFLLALLKYHITPGLYPIHRIRTIRTLPTTLHPPALSTSTTSKSHKHHNPQRIRTTTVPLIHLTRLNFRTRLLAGDFVAANGLIHAIDTFLIPPPRQTAIVRLLPAQFSTLALALERTGLEGELGGGGEGGGGEGGGGEGGGGEGGGEGVLVRSGGGTLFAPTNKAWARLGPKVNAFLFSEVGKGYLRALVKYHVVLNETVYSDAYYRGGEKEKGEGEEDGEGVGGGYWHVDLPSLLHGKPISVDIKTWKGFVSIVVNGFVRVVVRDGVADDGVIQVIGRVLIPPHKHHDGHGGVEKEDMSVEELKERLEPYLEESEQSREQEDMEDL